MQVNARVDDADSHAAPVPSWVGGHELRCAGVADWHVGVVLWCTSARLVLRVRKAGAAWSRPRIFQREDLVQIDCLDAAQAGHGLRFAGRDDSTNIADVIVTIAHRASEAGDAAGDRLVRAGL